MSTQIDPSVAPGAGDAGQASEQPAEVVLTYREAINAALRDEMTDDATVLLIGEDVGEPGGPFKTNEGLLDTFGPKRVIDTPICENSFMNAALGMAVTGLRPVVEIMFSDFLPTAGDAIVNEVPKYRFMSGGQTAVPLTIRAIGGATGRFGTQHSATGESWYLQVAGLRVVTASSPAAAYGLLRTAIRSDDPVLFVEHKGMYARKGAITRDADALPEMGRAEIVREGRDVTIIATLLMVERALKAAEALAEEGIDAEVIDLRWINPIDYDTVRTSVDRTGRLVIAEEQYHAGGWGATIVSRLTMEGVSWKALPVAVSLPEDLPIAFSPPLEDAVVPSAESIATAARKAMAASR
jgi:pyruvate dehydrogenase E1 component beta subunit